MTSQSTSLKRGLPLWANLLMLIVITTVVATGSGVFALFMLIRQTAVDATLAERILANAKKIAVFPEPLPDGYKYLFASDLGFVTVLAVEHEPDKQQIAFWCMNVKLPADMDSKSFLNQFYDMGINTFYTSARFHELIGHGTETIAAQEMLYSIGAFTDADGHNSQGMVACICLNKAAKNILIYSYPNPPNAYNQQVALDLLRTIKGF